MRAEVAWPPLLCWCRPPQRRPRLPSNRRSGPVSFPHPIAQQAYLKASNTESNDSFGYSIAVSGDTLVVASAFEDSSAPGVNGDQNDENAYDAGAAYVFVTQRDDLESTGVSQSL